MVFANAAITIPICAVVFEIAEVFARFDRDIVIASTSVIPEINDKIYIPFSPSNIENNFDINNMNKKNNENLNAGPNANGEDNLGFCV